MLNIVLSLIAVLAAPGGEEPPVTRQFNLAAPAGGMRELVPHRLGAIVSDKVSVDGRPVGYMYRAPPHNPLDSGWRFLAGDEDEAFMADASRHAVLAVNTIANHDPAVLPFLDGPVGSAFFREGESFVPDPEGAPGS